MSCPNCGTSNQATARFCKSCGLQFSPNAAVAAQAAADAAASSSGRQPWTPEQRRRHMEQRSARPLPVPRPTGRGQLADLAQAEDHFVKVDAEWDRLDMELRGARSLTGMFPTSDELAELAGLERRTNVAWASRQAAFAHRQRLWDAENSNEIGGGWAER